MANCTYSEAHLYETANKFSKYGYLYFGIVTFLDGSKAYKMGYTTNASTRFKQDNTIKDLEYLCILPHVEEHHRGLPASKYTMWEAQAHRFAFQLLDNREVQKFRETVKNTGFSGYSECYPYTPEADMAIAKAILHVNELLKAYTDNVWFD